VAPEIIKIQHNEKYGPACDMFSVGCIFHLLITGQPVFPGNRYEEVYQKNKKLELAIAYQSINAFSPGALDILKDML
jgi:serine/threonine protein kinase